MALLYGGNTAFLNVTGPAYGSAVFPDADVLSVHDRLSVHDSGCLF